MNVATGKGTIKQNAAYLFDEVGKICVANDAEGIHVGSDETNCTITNDVISLSIELNVVDEEITVSEWNCRIPIPGEPVSGFRFFPAAIHKTYFVPKLSFDGESGWVEKQKPARSLSVAKLADKCVDQFVALVHRDEAGQIKRRSVIESQLSRVGGRGGANLHR